MERKRSLRSRQKASRVQEIGPPSIPAGPAGQATAPDVIVGHAEIASLAYSFWEARGRQGGSPEEDWLRAEEELKSRLAAPAVRRAATAGS